MPEFPPGVRIDLWAREWNGTGWDEAKLGSGPLPVMNARYEEAVDELGSFEFTMPAEHRMAALLKPSDEVPGARYVRIYLGNEGWVFLGEITHVETDISPRGGVVTVTGWSSARELTRLKTGYGWTLVDETMEDAVDALLAGTEWSAGTIDSAVVATYAHEFNGLTRLEALRKVAEVQGFLLRFDSTTREVHMGAMGTNPNGVRFRGMEGPVSPRFMAERTGEVIPIAHIRQTYESEAVVNKVRAVAQLQGIDGDDLTMAESNMSSPYTRHSETGPDGRTIHFLRDDASTAKHGPNEEDLVVREIRILGTGASDRQRAANTLYGVASTYLQRHKEPLTQYAVAPAGLKHRAGGVDLAPVGGRYPVQFRGWVQEKARRRVWVEVDAEPWLMARSRSIDASGQSSWELTWSTVPRRIPEDGEAVAEVLQEFRSAIAARIPTVTWGGTPPVGRLAAEGLQLVSPDDLGIGTNLARKLAWYLHPDFTGLIAEIAAQHEDGDDGMGGFITPGTYLRALVARSIEGEANFGFWDYAGNKADTMLQLIPSTSGTAILPMTLTSQVSGTPRPLFAVIQVGMDEWQLYRRKDGELVPVGGSMKATGKGPYEMEASGSATWQPVVAPEPTKAGSTTTLNDTTGTTHNVPMPENGGVGIYLMVVYSTVAFGTNPTGWTQLADGVQSLTRLRILGYVGNPGATVNMPTGSSGQLRATVRKFTGYGIAEAWNGGNTNNSLDPPSVTITAPASLRTIWVAASAGGSVPTGTPANYSDGVDAGNLRSVYRFSNSLTENPATFGGSLSNHVAVTAGVAIYGLSGKAYLIGGSATAAGLVEVAQGTSGNQVLRGSVGRALVTNERFERTVPIELAAASAIWLRTSGGSGTVRIEAVDEADLA